VPHVVEPKGRASARSRSDLFKPGLFGAKVFLESEYTVPGKDKKMVNWMLQCPRHGGTCQKSRYVGPGSIDEFGAIEPLAYLHAWIDEEADPGKTHRAKKPNPANVRRIAEDNRAALEAIVALFPTG
jgi:hypothetical protein